MKNRISIYTAVLLCTFIVGLFTTTRVAGEDVPRISIEELEALLGNPDTIILDVRIAKHWKSSGVKIKGAVREDPSEFDTWVDKYAGGKTLVFY